MLASTTGSSRASIQVARRTARSSLTPDGASGGMRGFKSSACRQTHYDTLALPHSASRGQIKVRTTQIVWDQLLLIRPQSSYYKLSKKYHPDLNNDPTSKEKFQKIGEAYAVLGDDRQRRAYDRSLAEGAGPRHYAASAASQTPGYWAYETRRHSGATHAWASTKRPSYPGYRHPGYAPPPGSSPYTHPKAGPQYHQDPFASPNVRKATGTSKPFRPTQADHVDRVSMFWRTMQVIGMVLLIATIGGGHSAKA